MARRAHSQAGPETAAEALGRARVHARRALGEAIAAMRALLDAASLGWSGKPSEAHAALRGIASLLDEQSERFTTGKDVLPAPMASAILEALDQEIARWEQRGDADTEARAVLRTFLGLREILWELGLRREEPAAGRDASPPERTPGEGARSGSGGASKPGAQRAASTGRRARVQRVDVRG